MHTSRLVLVLALALAPAFAVAAACGDATPTTSRRAARCGGGVPVGDGDLCVYTGAINETGFLCPMDMPFGYFGESWAVCSADEALAEAELAAALHEAEVPVEPTPAVCIDGDRDGVCLDVDPDDADPTVGPTTCADDVDGDGSCAGTDFDDHDASVRAVGIQPRDGGWDLVGCEASPAEWGAIADNGGHVGAVLGVDACQGIDVCLRDPAPWAGAAEPPAWVALAAQGCPQPGAGYLTASDQIGDAAEVCDDAAALCWLCWWSVAPCRDDADQVATCPAVDAPCRDDNRDGVCDP